MILQKRIGRTLKANKAKHLGIVILMLLGSFYMTAATGVAGNLEQMVVDFSVSQRQEDLTFVTDKPLQSIDALERETGAQIEAFKQQDIKLDTGELRLLSTSAQMNVPVVLSGNGLVQSGDILLDPRFCQMRGLQPGDPIEISGRKYNIAGTAALPNYVFILKNHYDVLPTDGFGIGLISDEDMAAFPDASNVYGAYFENREGINAQIVRLHGLLSEKGYVLSEWMDAKTNKRISMPWGNISSMKTMSLPVAVVFFMLGCLIVGVMVMRAVKADGVIIGTLYALGYRRSELTRHYMALPLLLAGLGGAGGTLLAMPLVRPVVDSMLVFYNLPSKPMVFLPINLALAVLMPITLTGLSSLLTIRKILRQTAATLMKGDGQNSKVNWLEKSLRLERFRFNTKYRIREQVRSIPRLLFLVLGVGAASMILLYGFTFNASMDLVMKKGALERYNYAIEYNFKEVQNVASRSIPEGAEGYNSLRAYPEGRERVEFYLLGMAPDSVGLKMSGANGSQLSKKQVNITEPLARRLKLKAGDSLQFKDKLNGQTYRLKIDGIIEAYGEQYIFMPLDAFNQMTGQPQGSYRTVLSKDELSYDQKLLSGVMDARDPEKYEEANSATGLIVASVTALAVLIAVIIIYLVTTLMLEESRSTISLFKVLGYRRKELARLMLNSTNAGVMAGFWLGLPLMLAFGNLLFGYVAEVTNMLIPMVIPPLYVLVSFVVIFGVYEATKGLCAKKLDRITMGDALKAGSE